MTKKNILSSIHPLRFTRNLIINHSRILHILLFSLFTVAVIIISTQLLIQVPSAVELEPTLSINTRPVTRLSSWLNERSAEFDKNFLLGTTQPFVCVFPATSLIFPPPKPVTPSPAAVAPLQTPALVTPAPEI